jgi:hypothetical protein
LAILSTGRKLHLTLSRLDSGFLTAVLPFLQEDEAIQDLGPFLEAVLLHLHFLVTAGGVDREGLFHSIPRIDDSRLAELFAREVLAAMGKRPKRRSAWTTWSSSPG